MLIDPFAQDSNDYNQAYPSDNVEAWSFAELQITTPVRLSAYYL